MDRRASMGAQWETGRHRESTSRHCSLPAAIGHPCRLAPAAGSTRQAVSRISDRLGGRPTGSNRRTSPRWSPESRRCRYLGPTHSQQTIRIQMNECVRCGGQCVPDFVARVEYVLSACAATYPVKGCSAQTSSSWLRPSERLPCMPNDTQSSIAGTPRFRCTLSTLDAKMGVWAGAD
jgi:hypothetical protein